jgi:DsbC/DsbD-like thiol-disulfide interchange protein
LEIALSPGWKTYWRSPGDAGVPPTIDWSGSQNVAELEILWPAPERFTLFGLDTFGYADQVIFPLSVRPERPGEPLILDAKVTYMVCEEICVPLEAALALQLPAGEATPSMNAYPIERWRARVPGDGRATGLEIGEAALSGSVDQPVLSVEATSLVPFAAPELIVEGPQGYLFRKPVVTLQTSGTAARFEHTSLHLDPGASHRMKGPGHNHVLACLYELVRLNPCRCQPLGEIRPRLLHLTAPVHPTERTEGAREVVLEVRCCVSQRGIPVPAIPRVDGGSHNLDVLLRHRLLLKPGGVEGFLGARESQQRRVAPGYRFLRFNFLFSFSFLVCVAGSPPVGV